MIKNPLEISNGVKKILVPIFLFLILLPVPIFSQEIEYPGVPGVATPTATTTFPAYVKYIFNFVMMISGLIALGVMIWGGILYLTSAGDPTQMSEARNKIFGALLGLIILLGSYLILYTINPQLTFLYLQKVEPTSGVCLCGTSAICTLPCLGEGKIHIGDTKDILKVSGGPPYQITFISPTSTLLAVYVYDDENFKGTYVRIRNNLGGTPTGFSFTPKSIHLLWRRPGVYLCPTTGTETLPWGDVICAERPLYTAVSRDNLGDYNDKVKSIQIIPPDRGYYRLILFEDTKYTSTNKGCPFVIGSPLWGGTQIDDLNNPKPSGDWWSHNNPPIGQGKLSSIIISYLDPDKQISGKVTFYDTTECPGEATSIEENIPSGALFLVDNMAGYVGWSAWDNKIRSFMISGPGGVALASDPYFQKRCRFFTRAGGRGYTVDGRGCITSLPTEICNPNKPETCPSSLIILPLPD